MSSPPFVPPVETVEKLTAEILIQGLKSFVDRCRVIHPGVHNVIDLPAPLFESNDVVDAKCDSKFLEHTDVCDGLRAALERISVFIGPSISSASLDCLFTQMSPTLLDQLARMFLTYGALYGDTKFSPRHATGESQHEYFVVKKAMADTGLACWTFLRSRPNEWTQHEQDFIVSEVEQLRARYLNSTTYQAAQLEILLFLEQRCDIQYIAAKAAAASQSESESESPYTVATRYEWSSPFFPRQGMFNFILGQLTRQELDWITELICTIPKGTANYTDIVKDLRDLDAENTRNSKHNKYCTRSDDGHLSPSPSIIGHLQFMCIKFNTWISENMNTKSS